MMFLSSNIVFERFRKLAIIEMGQTEQSLTKEGGMNNEKRRIDRS